MTGFQSAQQYRMRYTYCTALMNYWCPIDSVKQRFQFGLSVVHGGASGQMCEYRTQ